MPAKKQHPEVICRRLSFAPGIEIVRGSHVTGSFSRHIHHTFIIGLVQAGQRIISASGETIAVSPGEFFLLNPGQVHVCRSQHATGHAYWIFSVETGTMGMVAARDPARAESPSFQYVRYVDADLSALFHACLALIELPVSDLEKQESLGFFLRTVMEKCAGQQAENHGTGEHGPAISRVCDFIGRNFSEELSLEQLAGVAHLSPYYFQRTFVRIMGISAHEYLSHFRVRKAKELMLRGGEIADVALETGFFDQSHFSRVFQKTVGMTPGRYSRINRREVDK